jgi:hypothetical protein
MINILKAIGFTFMVVLVIVFTIAILYVSMWLTVGLAIVFLLMFTMKTLQAKQNL